MYVCMQTYMYVCRCMPVYSDSEREGLKERGREGSRKGRRFQHQHLLVLAEEVACRRVYATSSQGSHRVL